jgi:uncharacterized membrane protein
MTDGLSKYSILDDIGGIDKIANEISQSLNLIPIIAGVLIACIGALIILSLFTGNTHSCHRQELPR